MLVDKAAQNHADEIDVEDIARRVFANWKVLFLAGVVGAVLAFTYSKLLLPKAYESRATIFVQQSSPASSMLQGLPINIGSSGSSANYLIALLESDAMLQSVSKKLNLAERLINGQKLDRESLLYELRGQMQISEKRNGSIVVAVRAHDPKLAAEIANTTVDSLGKLVSTRSQRKASYISTKLAETEEKLESAESKLARFQERHNLAELPETTKSLINRLTSLDAQLVGIEVELQTVQSQLENSGDLESLVDLEVKKKSLESSKAYLEDQIRELQNDLEQLPSISLRYARLQREIGVLTKTYEVLTEQEQIANISQRGEDGDYQIIDRARPTRNPVAPRSIFNAGLGGLIGFGIAAVFTTRIPNRKNKGYRRPCNNS